MDRRARQHHVSALAAYLVASFGAAAVGSAVTVPALDPWYRSLRKPDWTPPDRVFGPVWTILYVLMALAAWLVRRNAVRHPARARTALLAWAVQLVLNAAWSATFFGRRDPAAGVVVITALWAALAATIVLAARVSRRAATLLLPYLAWTTFAAALNIAIWRRNRAL
ncbi:MAG: tryptophan-rich sensory protein [Chloroflexota bacterium]